VAEELLLDFGVLDDGLDHEICGHETVHGRDARENLGRIRATFLGELAEASVHRLECATDHAGHLVVERDTPTRSRDHLGDPAAHLTRADNENVLEAHGLDPWQDVTYIRSGKDPHKADDLRRGVVDAVSVGENAPLLAADGFPVLVDFAKIYPNGYQERVLVVTGKTLRERPEALIAFMKGYLRGNRFIMDRPNGRRVLDYTYSLLESDRLRGGEWASEAERDWPSCQKEDCTRFPVPVDGSITLEGLDLVMKDEKAAGKIPADMRAEDCVRLEFVEGARRKVDARLGAGAYK